MSIVSANSVDSIYNLYHIMKFYGGYDITEIDNMNPQERDIFYYLLIETIKEKNKAREQQRMRGR